MHRTTLFAALLFAVASVGLPAHCFRCSAQNDDLFVGLVSKLVDAKGNSVQRIDLSAAWHWEDGTLDPRLHSGAIKIQSSGLLEVLGSGEHEFAVYGSGEGRVFIDGQELLAFDSDKSKWTIGKPVELSFGFHDIEIKFVTRKSGADLNVYWRAKRFRWEPLQSQYLYHETGETGETDLSVESVATKLADGRELVHALRCNACHKVNKQMFGPPTLLAPDLTKLSGNVRAEWLIDRLADNSGEGRMPHFGLDAKQATSLAAFLLKDQPQSEQSETAETSTAKMREEDQAAGRELFLTTGCVACHQVDAIGQPQRFDGGDLSHVADKRPAGFFARWLNNPASINKHHRMPVFELSEQETRQLSAWLGSLHNEETNEKDTARFTDAQRMLGARLFDSMRCSNCHQESKPTISINRDADWAQSCLEETDVESQPLYRISESDKESVRAWFDAIGDTEPKSTSAMPPDLLLAENNCFSCHSRSGQGHNGINGLQANLTKIADAFPELASVMSEMTPPSLNSIGDKMERDVLIGAIRDPDNSYRDWLRVRMPKFRLDEQQTKRLADHFISHDRIPELPAKFAAHAPVSVTDEQMNFSAPTLVTPNGLSCTSCHQIGSQIPSNAPANARGPHLNSIRKRMRQPWFERWLHDPARIVPGMEMPSVRVPVKRLLNENLDLQVEALWRILNKSQFEPPPVGPLRVVRPSDGDRAVILADIVNDHERTWIKPFLIGLPNKHNLLFNLESGTLQRWWQGDFASLRNSGKSWYWEPGAEVIRQSTSQRSELLLQRDEKLIAPNSVGQFVTEPDAWRTEKDIAILEHRLVFPGKKQGQQLTIAVEQTFAPIKTSTDSSGFRRTIRATGLPADQTLVLVSPIPSDDDNDDNENQDDPFAVKITADSQTPTTKAGEYLFDLGADGAATLSVDYTALARPSQDEAEDVAEKDGVKNLGRRSIAAEEKPSPESLDVLPGFISTRLPISDDLMATGISWRPNGEMLVAGLKGRLWSVSDSDADGLEDRATAISDDLSTPYGLQATNEHVDLINKFGLLRLTDADGDGFLESAETVASGWGHTADYHDWAVGLPTFGDGYLIGLPCQQDSRNQRAAKYRGTVIQLVPRHPDARNPRRYDIEVMSTGHRFPMGIAVDRQQEIFVTDNQGNYNPFNELNHVTPGAFFGFINKIEKSTGNVKERPLKAPAIDIPHPWTRSVNGICFLHSPPAIADRKPFGPFEGNLIGCEYDSKRLIRMTIQRVGDTLQGAAYPFSLDPEISESGDAMRNPGSAMLGPIVCAVSPQGGIVVGSFRESGWGAGNNIGELIRMQPDLDNLPTGILKIELVADGFEIEFTGPVDKRHAADASNYLLSSYTRTSTPQYGGDDQQRRSEKIRDVAVSEDGRSVRLELDDLRANFVYEFRLKPLIKEGRFFPNEAFYTLRRKF